MKYVLLFLVFSFTSNVISQSITFNDPNFKAALINNPEINTDGDTVISIQEADAYTGPLSLVNLGITNIDGIEFFKNIVRLDCDQNELETLTLNNFPKLGYLSFRHNQLTTLELDSLPNLNYLNSSFNKIKEFDLDFSHRLAFCFLVSNELDEIDFSSWNGFTRIGIGMNNISDIDVSHCTNLESLTININNVSSIDVSQNPELTNLNIGTNPISTLNLQGNPILETLQIDDTDITEIDLSDKDSLNLFSALYMSIPEIDFTKNPSLEFIRFITTDSIEYIDVTKNLKLKNLTLRTATLNTVDLFNNLELETIDLSHNQLRQIELTVNTKLQTINLEDNELVYLNIANGNNDSLSQFKARTNPNLFCIQVDSTLDLLNLPISWIKDDQAEYNGECPAPSPLEIGWQSTHACTVSSEDGQAIILGQGGISPYTYRLRSQVSSYDSTSTSGTFKDLRFGYYDIYIIDAEGNVDSGQFLLKSQFHLIHPNTIDIEYSTGKYLIDFCPEDEPINLSVEGFAVDSYDFNWSSGSMTRSDIVEIDSIDYNILISLNDTRTCEIKFKGVLEDDCMISNSENLINKPTIEIYPNPTTGIINMESGLIIDKMIKVLNAQGQLITTIISEHSNNLDLSNLKTGIYLIRFSSGSKLYSKKLIKY